jgi:sulfur carrier protein ThiS
MSGGDYEISQGKAVVKKESPGQRASVQKIVMFRFYEELNDYLPEKARKKELRFDLNGPTTVRKAIASLGIPSNEVDLILINGASVGLRHRLRDGDRVSVYPIFERLDISGVTKVRDQPLIKRRPPKK